MKRKTDAYRRILHTFACSICLGTTACTGPATDIPEGVTIISAADVRELSQPRTDEQVDFCEYIPLETRPECLIGDEYRLQYYDDKFFIRSRAENSTYRLLVFNRNGKFLNQIGTPGKGPQEYTDFSQFAIDETKNEAIIVDGYGNKILRYDFNGKYISASPLPDNNLPLSRGIYMLDNGKFLSASSVFMRPMPMYTLYSPELEAPHVIREMGYTWIGSYPFANKPVARHGGRTLMLAPMNDTIYRLNGDAMVPTYVLNCRNAGKTWDNPENTSDYEQARKQAKEAGFIYPYGILENDRYLLIQYLDTPILWDKQARKGIASEFGYFPDSLKNTPMSLLGLEAAAGDMFIGLSQPYSFLPESETILANNPELKTLAKTVASMKEDDNPIVIIFHVK